MGPHFTPSLADNPVSGHWGKQKSFLPLAQPQATLASCKRKVQNVSGFHAYPAVADHHWGVLLPTPPKRFLWGLLPYPPSFPWVFLESPWKRGVKNYRLFLCWGAHRFKLSRSTLNLLKFIKIPIVSSLLHPCVAAISSYVVPKGKFSALLSSRNVVEFRSSSCLATSAGWQAQ